MAKKNEKDDSIDHAIEHFVKLFGNDSIRRAGEYAPVENPISTRYPDVDAILGCGGIPRGKVVEIYGPEASGKTWLCLNIISSALLDRLSRLIDYILY